MASKRELRYYAVRDAVTGEMTFWYRNKKGEVHPWPPRPNPHYGPSLWKKPRKVPGPHDHVTPQELRGNDRRAWVNNWYRTVRQSWLDGIMQEIDQHPEEAMARFAAFATRCCICGKVLTDPATKVNGIGPECIQHLPEGLAAFVQKQMRVVIAEGADD